MTPKRCVVSLNPHRLPLSSASCCCAVAGPRAAQGEQSHGYEHLVHGRLGSKDGNGLRVFFARGCSAVSTESLCSVGCDGSTYCPSASFALGETGD